MTWQNGKEVPFPNTECAGRDADCSIGSTNSVAFMTEYSFNAGSTLSNKKRQDEERSETRVLSLLDHAMSSLSRLLLVFATEAIIVTFVSAVSHAGVYFLSFILSAGLICSASQSADGSGLVFTHSISTKRLRP